MTWADFPWGPAVTIAVLMWAVALLAMDERNRRKFVPREDSDGMRKRLEKEISDVKGSCERIGSLHVLLDDRVGDLEEKAARLEERQTLQWERIAEQMSGTAKTIEDVARRLERISEMQQEHALRLERLHGNHGGK